MVYLTLYVVSNPPPVISPLVGSISAPSLGRSTKLNIPPVSPRILAVAPLQFGINSNDELSCANVVTSN